jgi:hypothetical protein
LDQECVWQLFLFSESLVDQRHDVRRVEGSELEQLVSELVSFVALGTGTSDGDRKTAQVFDERQSQRDCDCPQLTYREWRDSLISSNESLQRVCVESRIVVRDYSQGDGVNSWVVFQFTAGEFRKLVVVALWQVLADLAELLFDDVIVVYEPFSGR